MQTSDKKIPSKTYQGFSVHKHRDIYVFFRAESGTRTRDLRITNALLYQLSYFGDAGAKVGYFMFSAK